MPMHSDITPIYVGSIVDQSLSEAGDALLVVMTVRIEGRLRNPRSPVDDIEAVQPVERDVTLYLGEDSERSRISRSHLRKLGIALDDVPKLHPDHPEFVTMVGRPVYLRQTEKNDRNYWNLAWPLRPVGLDTVTRRVAGLQATLGKASGRSMLNPAVPATNGEALQSKEDNA